MARAAGVRRVDPRAAPRGEAGRAVGDGAGAGAAAARRRVYRARSPIASTRAGAIPGHAQARLRRGGGNDHADAQARDRAAFARGALARGAVGGRPAGLVFDEGCPWICRRSSHETTIHRLRDSARDAVPRDGSLDEAGVSRLARRQIDAGIHFLVPCGTTGEVPTLTDAEQVRVVELVVDEAQRTSAGARRRRRLQHARSDRRGAPRMKTAGADGILSVTPYYNKPTPEGLYPALQRDRRRGRAADHRLQRARPHRLQRRSGDAGSAQRRAAHRRRQGSVGQHDADVRDLRRACPNDFIVLSGDDALTLPLMAVGGRGVISVASNEIPAEMSRMVELAEQRRLRRRARAAPAAAAADAGQLRRVESDSGEERDGDDGAARRGVPAADGAAAAGVASSASTACSSALGLGAGVHA